MVNKGGELMSPLTRLFSIVTPILFAVVTAGCAVAQPAPMADATQGWTEANRVAWYTASQGSRLIPRAWLDALEQPDGTGMFLDPAYINNFRYLPNPAAGWDSRDKSCPFDKALPLGFAVDCQSDKALTTSQLHWKANQSDREPWVGMNCSACHTAEMTYKGTTFRADGGPSMTDFQGFMAKLVLAVHETVSDPAKLGRFSTAVLGPKASPADQAALKLAIDKWTAWNDKLDTLNDPNSDDPANRIPAYGFGRLDAIGHIYNKIALIATPTSIAHQIANPADAPTSFPFLWNVPQLDRVEWNGIAVNSVAVGVHYGALGRNTGEVIGVFGNVGIKKNPGLGGYASSVNVKALNDMEAQLARLQPPRWPAAFGGIDAKLADTGRQLFAKDCAGCHTVPTKAQGDLTETIQDHLAAGILRCGNKPAWFGDGFLDGLQRRAGFGQQRSVHRQQGPGHHGCADPGSGCQPGAADERGDRCPRGQQISGRQPGDLPLERLAAAGADQPRCRRQCQAGPSAGVHELQG